jgi:RNA recognition motif-containing protein
MGTRLFLGNLPWATTSAELEDVLRSRGVIFESVKVVEDRDTGRSRGFAFVELGEGADAGAAKQLLEGVVVGERDLHVEDANERPPQTRRDHGGPGGDRRGPGGRGGRGGRGSGRGHRGGGDYGDTWE